MKFKEACIGLLSLSLFACGDYDVSAEGASDGLYGADTEQASDLVETETRVDALMSTFDPAVNGLKFVNTFDNQIFDFVRSSGLCGGMVYTALDYFHSGRALPKQDYPPSTGTTLRDYLYSRQVNSIESNVDKWAELGFNPFGWRNDEFWRWGLQSNARVPELKKAIDAGKPAPLGLWQCDGCGVGNHQVLAIGYELGAYSAEFQGYPNLRIYVYDPNYPGQTKVLKTDTTTRRWYYDGNKSNMWLTYFVDANYRTQTPPSVSAPSSGLVLEFKNGAHDLRGDIDNVTAKVTYKDGSTKSFSNLNKNRLWMNNSREWVGLSAANPENVTKVQLITKGVDTWTLDAFRVRNIVSTKTSTQRYYKTGAPLSLFQPGSASKTYTLN